VSRNIVLVSIDSIRADHCGYSGYSRNTTPELDTLAQEGIIYTNAIAPGQATPASMPAIFTGTYQTNVEGCWGLEQREGVRAHLGAHSTIPERLKRQGYSTAGFTPNPYTSRYFGFSRGFDHFEDFLDRSSLLGRMRNRIVSRWVEGEFVAGLRFGLNMLGWGDISMSWESYYDRLLSRVQSMSEPFFLWVFLLEPHWPYRPSKEHRNGRSTWEMYNLNWKASPLSDTTPNADDETGINDLYNGAVREADRFLGRIREDLASYDPVYVIHGDHGEALGERGNWGHGSLYDEVIRVPLVVANAGDEASVDRPTSLRMLSRLIETIGQDDSVDWESLGKPYVLSKTRRDAYAIRGRDWKFYERDGTASFFDLEADPGELSPISPDSVHVGSTLKDLVSLYDHRFEESQQIARAVTDRFT